MALIIRDVLQKKYIGMLRTLARGWYLHCYKCRRINLSLHPNTYSRQSSFLFRGNSRIQFNHLKANKQSKADILMKLTKNLVIIASCLWTRYWINLCVNIRIDTILLPLSHAFTNCGQILIRNHAGLYSNDANNLIIIIIIIIFVITILDIKASS